MNLNVGDLQLQDYATVIWLVPLATSAAINELHLLDLAQHVRLGAKISARN
jgi:hypothetical protein